MNIQKHYDKFNNYLSELDKYKVIKKLTMIWPMVFISEPLMDLTIVPTFIICLFGLIFDKLQDFKKFYVFLLFAYLLHVIFNINTLDNHKWIFLIWILSLINFSNNYNEQLLKINARVTIIGIFLMASIWKLVFGEYLDNSFLEHTIFIEKRLHSFAHYILNIPIDQLKLSNFIYLNPYRDGNGDLLLYKGLYELNYYQKNILYISGLGTIIIEALIAISLIFNLKIRNKYSIGDMLLVLFVSTLYFVLPIHGFAGILLTLGLAQCSRENEKIYYIAIIINIFSFFESYKLLNA